MNAKPKDEALAALKALLDRLRRPDSLDGLERATLTATTRYALEQVEAIQELKRARKAQGPAVAPEGNDA